jgi:hypothetical protein
MVHVSVTEVSENPVLVTFRCLRVPSKMGGAVLDHTKKGA